VTGTKSAHENASVLAPGAGNRQPHTGACPLAADRRNIQKHGDRFDRPILVSSPMRIKANGTNETKQNTNIYI
jgi:hypothetical protein